MALFSFGKTKKKEDIFRDDVFATPTKQFDPMEAIQALHDGSLQDFAGCNCDLDDLTGIRAEKGRNFLHLAAVREKLDATAAMLKEGERPTIDEVMAMRDDEKASPFHLAADNNCLWQMKNLIQEGEKKPASYWLEKKNAYEQTVFHSAAALGRLNHVTGLMPDGEQMTADQLANSADEFGQTIADKAAKSGHLDQLFALMPEKDQATLLTQMIKQSDPDILYDPENKFLKAMEKAPNLSVKHIVDYEKGAPNGWKNRQRSVRIDYMRKRVRQNTASGLAGMAPAKRGREN